MNQVLVRWNALEPDAAAEQVLPCCGSRTWATQLAANRPFPSAESMIEAADRVWRNLPEADQQEAFATHPRIGERHASATAKSLVWSAAEQSSVAAENAQAALAEANRLYEEKFHRTFIVCATGRSAPEILTILHRRLANTPGQERTEAAEQQRQITNLRLHRWLEGG